MAKNTITMKRFKANLTKISRLAKSGYNSITSVAKQIIATVTTIASKIAVVSGNAGWQGGNESLPSDAYQSYYDQASKAEEAYLNNSLQNLGRYKDEIIFDIYTIKDALSHNTEQIGYALSDIVTKAFGDAAADFFESGKAGGNSFGDGFVQSVEEKISQARSMIISAMQSIGAVISSGHAAMTNVSTVTYSNPSYNFYSSGQTVSQQLNEARRTETVNALRGM